MTNYSRVRMFTILAILQIFLLVNFIFALTTRINFIDIGLPNSLENLVVGVFSFFLICLLTWEMRSL